MKRSWNNIKSVLQSFQFKGEVCISLIKEDGSIVCANSSMIRNFHLENPRLQLVNLFDVIHPINLERFRNGIKNADLNSLEGSNIKVYFKNGCYHPMQWSITQLEIESDLSKEYLCVGQFSNDKEKITEPEAILVSQFDSSQIEIVGSLKEKFFEQTPNLVWVVDENAKLIFASDAFLSFFKLKAAEVKNQDVLTLVPSFVSDSLYTKHLQVLKSDMPLEFIENSKSGNDQSLAFHVNIFPIKDKNGHRYIGGHAVNLKERFAVENQLQEANNRLLMINRATSDAIWEWDMINGTVFRNEALMDLIGYQQDDNKGLTWWFRRIHPTDRLRVSRKIRERTDNKEHTWEDEYSFKCADGSFKHMRDKGYIVYENGLPVKMIGSLQDISVLKALENNLTEEKLLRQKEITETVIKVQEKERTRIGLELHDNVNQILATTNLYLSMLKSDSNEQNIIKQKSIEYVNLAIEEIRKLSKDLVIPHFKNKDLEAGINSIINDIHLTTGLKIIFSFDGEIDMLTAGKKITIFRIVQEQIKNILKHSKATEVYISITHDQLTTCLVISDNGVGFDTSQLQTGIGLSNIYERTRFYNGTSTIDAAPGNGCVLTVTIPSH